MKRTWVAVAWSCLALLAFAGVEKKETVRKKGFSALLTAKLFVDGYPEIVSLRSREFIAQSFSDPGTLPAVRGASWPACRIWNERVAVKAASGAPPRVELLYSIDDRFPAIPDVFTVSGVPHFLLAKVDPRWNQWFNGLCQINSRRWYDFVIGVKADAVCDMGNRLLAASLTDSEKSFVGFLSFDFKKARLMEVDPPVAVRQLIRVDDSRLLVHKLRFRPDETAFDLYDLRGRRLKGFFDLVPVEVKDAPQMVAAGQTVAASNGRGRIYVTFQVQSDPYCIQVFDREGRRLSSFGNRFEADEEYEYPREWVRWDVQGLKRYGLTKVFAIHALLADDRGCVWVHFSRTSLAASWQGRSRQDHFLDGFGPDGAFIGRCRLPPCFPMAMGPGRVLYAKAPVFPDHAGSGQLPDRWVISVLRIVTGRGGNES